MSTIQRVAAKSGKTFAQARADALHRRAAGGPAGAAAAAPPSTVRLDFYGVGETVITVVPRRPARVGRPRKYATAEQRRTAQLEMRRRRRAERAAERARRTEQRRLQRSREKQQRRQNDAVSPQRRRQYRRAGGKKIEWPDLVAAGLIAPDAELFATLHGRRYTARFNGTMIDVDDHGTAASLSGAASLIVKGPRDGWEFWRVGEGRGNTLKQIRGRLVQ